MQCVRADAGSPARLGPSRVRLHLASGPNQRKLASGTIRPSDHPHQPLSHRNQGNKWTQITDEPVTCRLLCLWQQRQSTSAPTLHCHHKTLLAAQELDFRVEAANAVRCAANFESDTSAVRGQVAVPDVRVLMTQDLATRPSNLPCSDVIHMSAWGGRVRQCCSLRALVLDMALTLPT